MQYYIISTIDLKDETFKEEKRTRCDFLYFICNLSIKSMQWLR